MRRTAARITAVLTFGMLAAFGGGATAYAESEVPPPALPCKVKDAPDVTYTYPWVVTINLHTEAECFMVPVSVG